MRAGPVALGFRARDERRRTAAPASAMLRPGIGFPRAPPRPRGRGDWAPGRRRGTGERWRAPSRRTPCALAAPPLSEESGNREAALTQRARRPRPPRGPERRGGKGGRQVSCSRSPGRGPRPRWWYSDSAKPEPRQASRLRRRLGPWGPSRILSLAKCPPFLACDGQSSVPTSCSSFSSIPRSSSLWKFSLPSLQNRSADVGNSGFLKGIGVDYWGLSLSGAP